MSARTGTTVIGRSHETARLRDLAHRAATGQGAVLLVEGEPGAGKSTLLGVAATEGRRLGARIMRGGGTRVDHPAPFATILPWLDPELAIDAAGTADAGRDFAVTEAVLDRVAAWCAAGPVQLLIDDLHRADRSSLLLVGRLAQFVNRLPLLLVAAYQPVPRVPELDALLAALRGRGAVSMTLAPMADGDLAALAESLMGAPPDPDLRELLAGTGGNPRYAMEVLGALARTGRILVTDGVARPRDDRGPLPTVPPALVDLIGGRLGSLSPGSRDVLRAASVLGYGFDLAELAAVLDTPVISLWQPISEAVAAGLLTDSDGQLVFRHDLVRQALADEQQPAVTAALHLRAGRVLAAAGAPAERVARHLVAGTARRTVAVPEPRVPEPRVPEPRGPEPGVAESTATGLPPDVRDWLDGQAETLIATAPDLAVDLLRRAVAGGSAVAGDGTREVRLRWLLTRAYVQVGRVDAAVAEAAAALDHAPVDGGWPARLYGYLAHCLLLAGRFAAADAAATRALAAPMPPARPPAEPGARSAESAPTSDETGPPGPAAATDDGVRHALAVRAGLLLLDQQPAAALALADRALDTGPAEPVAAPAITPALRSVAAPLVTPAPTPVAALAPPAMPVTEPAPAGPRPHGRATALLVRGFCLLELDRLADADVAFAAGQPPPTDACHTWYRLGRARLRYLDGRWTDALDMVAAGLAGADPLGVGAALHGQAALIAMHRGDFGPYPGPVRRPDASPGGRYARLLRLSVRALHWERAGRPGAALDTLLGAGERGLVTLGLPVEIARLADISGQRGRLDRIADRLTADSPTAATRGTVMFCRGVADADPALLLASAAMFGAAGRPLHQGYAYEGAATTLAATGHPERARGALDSAVECYRRLGADWDVERALGRLRQAGVRHRIVRDRPKTGWAAMTPTERRIAALVAAGRSNPEIAAELYLSPRTVRNHVSHILSKLGLASRVELAVQALDQDG